LSLFTVDERCVGCGTCAEECPFKIIEAKVDETPKPTVNADKLCLNCGHCVAVCPQGALTHRSMDPKMCQPVTPGLLPSSSQVEHLLKTRRSIRSFLAKPVPAETLRRIIEIASYAPTGQNSQAVKWLVIDDRRRVGRLAGMTIDWMKSTLKDDPEMAKRVKAATWVGNWNRGFDTITWGAPHVVVAYAEGTRWEEECKIALTFLDLAAYSEGIGACWGGLFNLAARLCTPMRENLGLPDGHSPFGAMMLGYPKNRFYRIPIRMEPNVVWK